MKTFTHRMPDDLHEATRLWLARRPWANQTEMINEAVKRLVLFESESFVRDTPLSLDDCVGIGWLAEEDARRMRVAISRGGERILILGDIGSGRTTIARALLHEYQKVRGFPRRAILLAVEPKEYVDKETPAPMLVCQIDSARQKTREIGNMLSESFTEKPPRYDIVFIDANIDIGEESGIEDFFKRSRKLGVSIVFTGLGRQVTQTMIQNASMIVTTERNKLADVQFEDEASEFLAHIKG